MNDPVALHAHLVAGALGPGASRAVVAVRSALREAHEDLHGAGTRAHRRWRGHGARAAASTLRARATACTRLGADLDRAGELLAGVARTQAAVRADADRVLAVWWAVARTADPVTARLVGLVAVRVLLALRSGLVTELARVADALDALGREPVRPPPAPPGTTTDPRAVAGWWAALTPAARARLEADEPDTLARLTGLPPVVLDRVNRARLHRDGVAAARELLAARSALAAAGASVADAAGFRLGTTARLVAATARWARVRDTAAAVTAAEASGGPGPVLLLGYRPEPRRGLVLSFGDPSTAARVAVVVPGVGSGAASPRLGQARALREQMDAAEPGATHAVVQWVDHAPPSSLTDPAVASAARAREAAPRLVADVAGWRAAHGDAGAQQVTVVGHSYGSTVVGTAATQGLPADDLVLVGSPGAGTTTAAALGVPAGHVWAAVAEHDPVVALTSGSYFSPDGSGDPTDPAFGARRFDVPDSAALLGAHSTYFDPGSGSLRAMAAIATGDGSAVPAVDDQDVDVRAALGVQSQLADAVDALAEVDLRTALTSAGHAGAELGSQALDVVTGAVGDLGEGVHRVVRALS